MIYRPYTAFDYDGVRELLMAEYKRIPRKDEFGGIGIVFEIDGKIEGFVWALTSKSSSVCFIDYFLVSEKYRGNRACGPNLMMELFRVLMQNGIKIVKGVLLQNNPYSVSCAKIYKQVGLSVCDALYLVSGDVEEIAEGMKVRYG